MHEIESMASDRLVQIVIKEIMETILFLVLLFLLRRRSDCIFTQFGKLLGPAGQFVWLEEAASCLSAFSWLLEGAQSDGR